MKLYTEKKSLPGALMRIGTTGLLVLASTLALHGQVYAQVAPSCPAGIGVEFDPEDNSGPFEIGEPIPIKVILGMGSTNPATDVLISKFAYKLDCGDDEGFSDCTSQGNMVEFLPGTVETTCTNAIDETPTPVVTIDDGLITVDFFAEEVGGGPSAFKLPSTLIFPNENSCNVTFDVVVNGVADQNAKQEIVEITGWGETDAVCTNTAESSGTSASLALFISNPNVIIRATKNFTDDNESEVDVRLFCDGGSYTDSVFQIVDPVNDEGFDKKDFVIYNIPQGGVDCRVWEAPVPSGYTESYLAGFIEPAIFDDFYVSDSKLQPGCVYEGVQSGLFTCEITNTPKPATFTVNKEWLIYNNGGAPVNEKVDVTAICDKPIVGAKVKLGPGPKAQVNGGPYKIYGVLGDGDSLVGVVDVRTGPAKCFATEDVRTSGVESFTDDCDKQQTLTAGGSAECTFVNTVFFEGIPTLSQYGKLLLILLTLGVGMIGFRRFV